MLCCCWSAAAWGQKTGPRSTDKVAVAYAKRVNQGFSMKIWLSNQMTMGLQAWDVGSGPDIRFGPAFGLEYPAGSEIEHLYGAGPWVGGLINGVRHVTEGYNGDSGEKFFLPDTRHPLRQAI